jgi:DNA polymerase I-like protein with 3'-5' exonuclease and polymerase domains
MISLDTETTGLDVYHSARPFFVTTCDEDGEQGCWEWRVDPLTRKVEMPRRDAIAIRRVVEQADRIVLQNSKFDVAMLREAKIIEDWPWEKAEDTLIAGHVLRSNQAHDLTTMALVYLGVDIQPFEKEMEKTVKKARNWARRHKPEWRIAKAGLPEMPSVKEFWKADMWLLQHYEGGKYAKLLRDYSNADSAVTLKLWQVFEEKLKEEGLWEIYRESMKKSMCAVDMERRGVTLSRKRLEEQAERYAKESAKAGKMCVAIARTCGYDLQLPKSGNNGSLTGFCFGKPLEVLGVKDESIRHAANCLNLPIVAKSKKTGAPSFDKAVVDYYLSNLDEEGKQHRFVKTLSDKRKRDTAVQYMAGYRKFWLAMGNDFYVLHPSLNPTGTDTLRWSSSNPNEQNISKKEGFNLRYSFGPAPGREWWSLDYENIERRIPAFEAGEELIIKLFESPDEPPFYGSEHLLNASIIFTDLFWPFYEKNKRLPPKEFIAACKKQPWYRPTKNTGFAIQYGCQEAKADATAGRSGAYKTLRKATPKIFALSDHYFKMASRLGYVETLPDKSIGAERGYPIWCTRSSWGGVSPTIPFNYHIQSTAMWCTARAMVRCKEYLEEVSQEEGEDYFITMQVHDEIVFDLPAKGKNNLAIVRRLQEIMEMSGDDIGIPLKVSASYHPNNWSEEESYED